MRRRSLDIWAAMSDLGMALFVCTLVLSLSVSAKQRKTAEALEAKKSLIEEQRTRIASLEEELARQTKCPEAEVFLAELGSCLGARGVQVSPGVCSVAIGEDFIKFGTDEPAPAGPYRKNARTLASCVASSSLRFAHDRPEEFSSIEAIFIDGHTDCVGDPSLNTTLGADRAAALYRYVLDELRGAADAPRVLSSLAIRSFGESRPTQGSECGSDGWPNDRRVVVSVQLRLQGGATRSP